MQRKKRYLKCEDVKVIKTSQYKGLRVHEILSFAEEKISIAQYFPEYEYAKEPSREWLWNVVNSLIPKEFKVFVDEQVILRKESIVKNQNLHITAKNEFVEIFKASKAVSLEKGKSHFLARLPKMNKYKLELGKVWEEKEEGDHLIQQVEAKITQFNSKMEEIESKMPENED